MDAFSSLCLRNCIARRQERVSQMWSVAPRGLLLRKEVIQPHLPVRLPCSGDSPCRHEAWTISSPCSRQGLGVWSLRGQERRAPTSLLIVRAGWIFTSVVKTTASTTGCSEFPAYSRVFHSSLPMRVATGLRLRPDRESCTRRLPPLRVGPPASCITHFQDVTGGVYKARERIHRSMLICDY